MIWRRNSTSKTRIKQLSVQVLGGLALGMFLVVFAECAFAHDNFIINVDELKQSIDAGGVVILDARNKSEYAARHIPGAVNAWWEDLADVSGTPKDPGYGNVLSKDRLAKILGGYGIDRDTKVVVYADARSGWGEDGRLVWILKLAGVKSAKMLCGGMQAWTKRGWPTVRVKAQPVPKKLDIRSFDAGWTADMEWVKKNKAKIRIVDARTIEEYNGAQLFGEARGGHIPGAVLIPFASVFESNGRTKSKAALKKMFLEAGLSKQDPIIVYCTAGIRSAHMTLLLRMVGFTRARNFDDSFYGWAANTQLPIEK